MKTLPGFPIGGGFVAVVQAARITDPDAANYPHFAADVAVNGDAIATLELHRCT